MKRLMSLLLVLIISGVLWLLRYDLVAWWLRLPRRRYVVTIERGIKIQTADGISLAADLYTPQAGLEEFPTIVIRSPYGRNRSAGIFGLIVGFCASRFAEQGYFVLTVDTRGRFDSGGEFEPYVHERADGLTVLKWLKGQSWFSGEIGLWGPSYLGITQWVIADAPEVKAMMPIVTASKLYDVVFPDGVLDLGLVLRWMSLLKAQNIPRHRSLLWAGSILPTAEYAAQRGFRHLPVQSADQVVFGETLPYYQQWLVEAQNHPETVREMFSAVDLTKVTAKVHFVGGWYDFFLRGLLDDYTQIRANGQNPYLTIGGWHHFSNMFLMFTTITPAVHWFNAHLKGQTSQLRPNPVQIQVMGSNKWRKYEAFPPISQPKRYYLGQQTLQTTLQDSPPDQFTYDPDQPLPYRGGTQFHLFAGARDNRDIEQRPDVLLYTSPILTHPLEIIGAVRLELYIKSDQPHTDFFARLCDVSPDGKSVNICDGLFRVTPEHLSNDEGVHCVEIDLWTTAHCFQMGHQLRLIVSSSAHPRWMRNTGSAQPYTDLTLALAHQTVFHDPQYPSALILPVL